MPRAKGNTSAATESFEPENSIESDEKVDLDEDEEEDPEEAMDEEVEYEEVEEEVEEIEEEEVIEMEDDEEEDNANNFDESRAHKSIIHDDTYTMVEDEQERRIQAELLSRPPHGSEVYVGGIPLDASEEELRCFCETAGVVTEVRLMKGKDSNENKGFAFVTFRNVDLASQAIDKLNNTEFKGKRIKCSTSQAKHRLFLGNIPRSWKEEDLKKVVTEVGPGVTAVQLVKDVKTNNNRGFAFIDYYNNACAEYSRQKMMNPKFKLGDNAPTVSWADSKTGDSSASSQVKTIYVKNLPKDVNQDQLKKLFEHHGKITKVVLPPAKSGQEKNRIGFVHFSERSSAMKALKNTEKYELDGQVLECSLAKPQADQKTVGMSNLQKSGLLPGYPSGAGYGLVGGAFGAIGAGYGAAGFAQPMIYGRGPTPSGMAMMPMLLPDGRIGYVLQQPGVQQHTPPSHQRNYSKNGSGGSNRSFGRDGSNGRDRGRDRQQRGDGSDGRDGSNGRRYRPY
ncbi:heterogeneous nuclear ribonucleoprotein Q-like isoform X2 [Euphorbia lathyris]|uniref:heterogeneous nuclear ribonucleoprotein Q-like isoform X2 n=1 Tax=Euphorbia lathyris TaxID=212925 RepID=UPI003313721A